MTLTTWLGFLLAAILIAVTPGPGAVASMSAGMAHGYRQAIKVILGLQIALVIQLLIVAIGMGALLSLSETVFLAIKWLGAVYLIVLGVQKWRAEPLPVLREPNTPPVSGLLMQGVLVNLSNPKAILFVAALVPQFVNPSAAQWPQYLLIGATLCATDVIVMSGYALAAARVGRWFGSPKAIRWQNRLFGGVFVIAGGLLAMAPQGKSSIAVN